MPQVTAEPYEFDFEPETTALIVIDMQRDFVDPGGFGEALGNDVSLLQQAVAPTRRVLEAAWRNGYQAVAGRFGDMAPFYAWAGAMMERDLAAKIGRPGIWLQPSDLSHIHRWTAHWATLASLVRH